MKLQRLRLLQTFVLLGGFIYATYNIVLDFIKFYDIEGTIFKFTNTALPNPLLIPCFWGGVMFGICTYLSFVTYRGTKDFKKVLEYLVFIGTAFGWSVFSYSVYKYYEALRLKESFIACTGVKAENPIQTPCFYGASIYLLALVVTGLIYFASKKNVEAPSPIHKPNNFNKS